MYLPYPAAKEVDMNKIIRVIALFLASVFLLCACTTGGDTSETESNVSEEVFSPENAKKTLVSVGKPYTSLLPANERYPDQYGQQLTDGVKAPNTNLHYTDSRMVGYDSNGQYVIDLGEDGKRLYSFSVRSLEMYTDGVRLAGTVRFSGSNDNENWDGLGTTAFVVSGDRNVNTATLELSTPVNYRYIKVRVRVGDGAAFYFIDEIEIYADVEPKNQDDTVELSYKGASYEKNQWKSLSTSKKAEYSVSANIATGKSYMYSDCAFDSRAPYSNSDRDNNLKSFLTDSMPTGRMFGENYWVAFSGKDGEKPSVTVDLAKVYDNVYGFKVHALGNGTNVKYPDYIDFYGSKNGKDFTLMGRVYAPAGGSNFAYTLLLEEFINVKSVKFEFGGEGTFWVEELEVLAGYSEDYCSELFPPLELPVVTEDEFWAASEEDYNVRQNLLLGAKMHVSAVHYADVITYGNNTAPATNTSLTDGKRAKSTDRNGGEWFYMQGGKGYNFFYDLGKVSSVDTLVLSFLEYKDWAVNRPKFCDVFLSDDGINWYKVGTRNYDEDGAERNNYRGTYKFELDKTYSARFVRFRVEANGWLYLDEMEAFGTKAVTGNTVRLANSGLDSVVFYTNSETAQYATTENTPIKAENINLIYISNKDESKYNEKLLLPYVAYLDEQGNIVDTMMDGFVYLPASPLPSGAAPHAGSKMSDWEWLFENTFHGVYGFDKLDETVATVKDSLNKPDYKVQVYITLLTPIEGQTDFGDVDGDGINEDFGKMEDIEKVIRWYVSKCMDEFEKCGYENLELGGFYWMNESVMWEHDDSHIISLVADVIHDMGSYFMWIPYYTANRYYLGYEMGFDFVNMQPNVVFDLESPLWRFDSTAVLTKLNKMSVEIEHTTEAKTDINYARNYMLYLYYGAVYGYIDSIHVYYNDRSNFSDMAYSDNGLSRLQYDATYHFIKGDLDITPYTKDVFKAETTKDTILKSTLNPENGYSLFTLASMPKNGTVSLSADGSFAYYPDAGFTGKDTFTYTYNNLLGESEICTVEIDVK